MLYILGRSRQMAGFKWRMIQLTVEIHRPIYFALNMSEKVLEILQLFSFLTVQATSYLIA